MSDSEKDISTHRQPSLAADLRAGKVKVATVRRTGGENSITSMSTSHDSPSLSRLKLVSIDGMYGLRDEIDNPAMLIPKMRSIYDALVVLGAVDDGSEFGFSFRVDEHGEPVGLREEPTAYPQTIGRLSMAGGIVDDGLAYELCAGGWTLSGNFVTHDNAGALLDYWSWIPVAFDGDGFELAKAARLLVEYQRMFIAWRTLAAVSPTATFSELRGKLDGDILAMAFRVNGVSLSSSLAGRGVIDPPRWECFDITRMRVMRDILASPDTERRLLDGYSKVCEAFSIDEVNMSIGRAAATHAASRDGVAGVNSTTGKPRGSMVHRFLAAVDIRRVLHAAWRNIETLGGHETIRETMELGVPLDDILA